ncbi:MAG: MG2 domain-containing protein [Bacteroidota bacterium]
MNPRRLPSFLNLDLILNLILNLILILNLNLILILTLPSCSTHDTQALRVTSDLPSGVLAREAVITVAFSRGVVPSDSLNLWTNTPFIEFTPSLPGKFVWQDTTRLLFSADGPLPGDARFTGKLNTRLLTQMSGAASFSGSDEFSFGTERFTMKGAEFFYDRIGEKRQVGIRANLEFNYQVDPQDVASYIRVMIDDAPQQVARIVTAEKSRIIAIEIGAVTQAEKAQAIAVRFEEGLISPETSTRLWMERPFVYTLPPLAEMSIYGHEFGLDGTSSWVKVKTSQEVDAAAVKAAVTIDPVRPFTVTTDGQGFTLRGNFEPGTAFRLLIKKGMESVLGGKTRSDYEADIVVGNIAPTFRFASSSGLYMLMGGKRMVEVMTVNMPMLLVRVSQVFQNNLVFFLDNGRFYDYSYYDEEEGEGGGPVHAKYRYYLGNFGRQLSVDTLRIAGGQNQEVRSTIDLNPFMHTGYKGFYLVEIADPTQQWRSTSKLISISDIGLIAKQSADEVMVFATSLVTNSPMSGVRISLVSTTNQIIVTATTGGDGEARFSGYRETAKGFTLKLITAEAEEDFNFINLADYRVETSRFDVGGKRQPQGVYDAFLYGDRNIYRPGEKIVIAGIVRNLTERIPAGMPVKVKVISPRGNVVAEMQLSLNDEGSFDTGYQTEASASTGEYRIELYTGTGAFLTSYKVSVEDFVPDRLRVTMTASQDTARPGDNIRYDILALNFFGPPAAGRNWEFEGSFDVIPFRSERFPEFRFSDDAAKPYSANPEVFTGRTDEQGKATVQFGMPKNLTSSGLLRGKGRVAVFDESGRPVYQIAQTIVHPKEYFVGVLNRGAYYVSPNTPQKMQVVAVTPRDAPIAGFSARVEIIRSEWHSVLRQHQQTGTLRFVSERREIVERTDKITLGEKPYEYTYLATRSGDYTVRVSKEGDSGYNQFSFYSYSWGTSDLTSFEVDPEARVEVVFDKPLYAPGDKARVLFQTPFSGTMLVTVERNKVYSYRYLDVVNNGATMTVPVEEGFLPNVYISAVLFRRIKDNDIPLMAGHGFAPLMVERKSDRLDVSIESPQKIRPRRSQSVNIRTGGEKNVYVTLAAVDEGICQLKNYKTPNPYAYFYARKMLETETFDFFKHLIPEPRSGAPKSAVGGGEAELAQRTNPLGVQRFKPLAIWSGILKTNGSGETSVTLTIPEFNGELRLMALAFKGDRFGSAQHAMKVADPVVITQALPRFLAPGDSVVMPVTAFNTTDKEASLEFELSTEGPLQAGLKSASLDVGPNQERYTDMALQARQQIGKGVVKVGARALGERLESTTELPVRPTAPFGADVVSGFIDGGNTVSHDVPEAYLLHGRKAYVTLSPYPVANFAKELKHLLGYPHGCLEQTVSKAFPQIYLRDIAAILAPAALNTGSPLYYVNEAIAKITSMQLYDGAFAFWPGAAASNRWSTVYATHFLVEARRAGFAVPEATLKSALNAVAVIARSKATEDYWFVQGNRTAVRRIADKSSVYGLYVLALAGSPEKSVMDFYRSEMGLLTSDTRYLLAGAFAQTGERSTFHQVLPPEFPTEDPVRTSGGSFDSPVRANALMLNILLDTDLNNPHIPRLMEYLSSTYRSNRWYSTQDDAFTLLAFGKAARMASAVSVTGVVRVGGKEYAYKGGNQRLEVDPFGKTVSIAVGGSGRVYYSLVTEGIRTDGGVTLGDRNLQVRREFFDRSGTAVNPAAVRQNDLIVVRITLSANVDQLENIAITDLLPGGFELENPRITDATNYAFIKNPSFPEYMDIRDDRINLYTSVRGGKRTMQFYYAVRAVTRGNFAYPPIVAEAMYNADYSSASGGGRLRVAR